MGMQSGRENEIQNDFCDLHGNGIAHGVYLCLWTDFGLGDCWCNLSLRGLSFRNGSIDP